MMQEAVRRGVPSDQAPERSHPVRERAKRLALEYGLPLLYYIILTLAVSWPTARNFTTHTLGSNEDVLHNVWNVWHVREALLGPEPLFYAPKLYYPEGISLLTHGIGPLTGLMALPFWPLGLVAAYNGSVLAGFALTGFCMYLLARTLGLSRPVSLFAGTLLLMTPLHTGGLYGHPEKSFFGLLPLALVTLFHALRPRSSPWWAAGVGITLHLTLLHNGLQFVLTVFSLVFFYVVFLIRASRVERRFLLRRGLWIGLASLVFAGPLLAAIYLAARDPRLLVDLNATSGLFQPDLLHFFLPPFFLRLFGPTSHDFLSQFGFYNGIEAWVYLPWLALPLCLIAVLRDRRRALPWLLFVAGWAVLALGPSLQILGRESFTEYNLPVILPYTMLTALPGLDFLRTPGRLMLAGFVGYALLAALGLAWLVARFPRLRHLLPLTLIAVLLIETWPIAVPQGTLPPTPVFYQAIADDEELYGVLDLPVKSSPERWYAGYSAYAQVRQIVHGKGIASGYLSRVYTHHPVFPCLIPDSAALMDHIRINDEPADCAANTLYNLAANNFRYVVYHKPSFGDWEYTPGSWGDTQARAFLERAFSGVEPLADDELATVYAVPSLAELPAERPLLDVGANWHTPDGDVRWAASPAVVFAQVPPGRTGLLEVKPALIFGGFDGEGGFELAERGQLQVRVDDGPPLTIPLVVDEVTRIPVTLEPGRHTIELSLVRGNFRPSDHGSADTRLLSFAVRWVNMVLE